MKAGVRFVSYDHFKQMLADSEVSSGCPSQLVVWVDSDGNRERGK